jgi:hypothetical protein
MAAAAMETSKVFFPNTKRVGMWSQKRGEKKRRVGRWEEEGEEGGGTREKGCVGCSS